MIVSFFAFLCAHFKSDEGKPVKRYRDGSWATLPDSAEGGGGGASIAGSIDPGSKQKKKELNQRLNLIFQIEINHGGRFDLILKFFKNISFVDV